jgi:hypothetical protein
VAAVVIGVVAAAAAGFVGLRAFQAAERGPAAHQYLLPYVSPTGAFRALLPCVSPDVTEQVVSLGAAGTTTARMTMCDFDDHAVFVAEAAYPSGLALPPPDVALRGAADGAAVNTNGAVARFRQVDHDGLPAADVEIDAPDAHVHMLVVLGGSVTGQQSIVMAMVGSREEPRDADFDRLVETLSVTP